MYQLTLAISAQPTLHELKQAGRAFVARTWRGWSAWMPFRFGGLAGMYFTADSYEEALAEVAEFNQRKGNT